MGPTPRKSIVRVHDALKEDFAFIRIKLADSFRVLVPSTVVVLEVSHGSHNELAWHFCPILLI